MITTVLRMLRMTETSLGWHHVGCSLRGTKQLRVYIPVFFGGQVAAEEVGADAEEDSKQERQRVEDIDDTGHVGDGEQQ